MKALLKEEGGSRSRFEDLKMRKRTKWEYYKSGESFEEGDDRGFYEYNKALITDVSGIGVPCGVGHIEHRGDSDPMDTVPARFLLIANINVQFTKGMNYYYYYYCY